MRLMCSALARAPFLHSCVLIAALAPFMIEIDALALPPALRHLHLRELSCSFVNAFDFEPHSSSLRPGPFANTPLQEAPRLYNHSQAPRLGSYWQFTRFFWC